jgi:hypothetical protein
MIVPNRNNIEVTRRKIIQTFYQINQILGDNTNGMNLTPEEVQSILRANEGSRLRITFIDGLIQSVESTGSMTMASGIADPKERGKSIGGHALKM